MKKWVSMYVQFHYVFFFYLTVSILLFLPAQRRSISALTHDQGADVSLGVELAVIPSLRCIDHALNNTVNAGVMKGPFAIVFDKANQLVIKIRGSRVYMETLHLSQVTIPYLVFFLLIHILNCRSFLLTFKI